MNKAFSFVRLDFLTIKTYLTLKNIFFFILAPLIVAFTVKSASAAVGMLMMYAATQIGYTFAIGENNSLDALYATLSITRKTAVLGRYLFALFFYLCTALFAWAFSVIITAVLGKPIVIGETLLVVGVIFVVLSVVQAIQLPVLFKFGYAKAKIFYDLPFIILFLAAGAMTWLLKESGMSPQLKSFFIRVGQNPLPTVLIGAVVWFCLMFISYQLSLSFYAKRDF